MKVAIDASALVINRFSGLAEVVHNLLCNLSPRHDSNHFTLYMNYFLKPVFKNNIFYSGTTKRSLRIPRRLVDLWWQHGWPAIDFYLKEIDIFHSLHINVPPAKNIKTVLTVHDCRYLALPMLYNSRNVEVYRRQMENALSRVDQVVTVSEFTKRELITYFSFPEDRIRIIKNGFKTIYLKNEGKNEKIGNFIKKNKIPQEYIIYTGALDPRKNLSRLIEAIYICLKETQDFPNLVLAGITYDQWLKCDQAKKAKDLGIINRINVAGILEKKILYRLIKKAMALCYPSLYEGFGFPPLEAMSLGVPVLAGKCSAIQEIAGTAACLVDPLSVEEIAQGLKRIVFDDKYRKILITSGYDHIQKFSWRKAAEEYVHLYKEVIS